MSSSVFVLERRIMSQYIHFTESQKSRARMTDLVSLLKGQGEEVKRSGTEYQWRDGPDKVTIRGNVWFHQYDQEGGDAVDFVRRFYHKSYPEAVEMLLGESGSVPIAAPAIHQPKEKEPFVLPKRNDNMRRAAAYLLYQRGIDREVLAAFVHQKMIYESAPYHNVVFVGYDTESRPCHASMRGSGSQSTYKGNAPGSVPEFSFHWRGTNDRLFLFEAPIDMLSFISMHMNNWRANSYAAACSVSDRVLFQCLKDQPNIREVILCLDSDGPGQEATQRIQNKLNEIGIKSGVLVPTYKDWNQDLLSLQEVPAQVCQI